MKMSLKKKKIILSILVLSLLGGVAVIKINGALNGSKEAEGILRSAGMSEKLDAGVTVSQRQTGLLDIKDGGVYFTHYMIMGPNSAADPDITIDSEVEIRKNIDHISIVTHGWFDKSSDWPMETANAVHEKTDPNQWLCVSFDWAGGALVLSPLDAVKYAKNIAGPRLAKTILRLVPDPAHIHLVGHSAGAWVIDSAANIIAEKNKSCIIHLTYLDAYTPKLGHIKQLKGIPSGSGFAEHYYTKDITLEMTEKDLKVAHNISLSKIDPGLNEHEFPYRWYLATITGHYEIFREKKISVTKTADGLEYGFARSKEAGIENWKKSLTLENTSQPVELKKPED